MTADVYDVIVIGAGPTDYFPHLEDYGKNFLPEV
jgi:hypothetical protein